MGDAPLPAAQPAVVSLGHGRYLLTSDERQRIAYAAGPPEARWVFLEGRIFVVNVSGDHEHATAKGTDEQLELAAPMPATVAAVHVTVGQKVAQGDVLVTVEAMKMEMPIRAPRDGIVTAVRCAPRDLVQPGVPLVELSQDPG